MAARSFILLALLLFSGCAATSPHQNETDQFIRIENPNQFKIRAYLAFESSPSVGILLGTLSPYDSEIYPVPKALKGHRMLVVRCEKGPEGRFLHPTEYFETPFVMLAGYSTLVVRIRDPLRYSDITVTSAE